MKRKAWEYVVALRRDILAAISGIDNAGSYLWWDNTTPNSTTRYRLREILQNAVRDASTFGVYVVTRHTDCGRRSHEKVSDDHGYVWTDPYNLNVEWQDKQVVRHAVKRQQAVLGLGMSLQSAVMANMPDPDIGQIIEVAGDQQEAVTVQRVALRAHQGGSASARDG